MNKLNGFSLISVVFRPYFTRGWGGWVGGLGGYYVGTGSVATTCSYVNSVSCSKVFCFSMASTSAVETHVAVEFGEPRGEEEGAMGRQPPAISDQQVLADEARQEGE